VIGLAIVEVEPAEHEAFLLGVQRPQLRGGPIDQRVALHQAGGRAGRGPPVAFRGERAGLRAHLFHPRVDPVDDLLFGGDLLRSDVGHNAPPVRASFSTDEHMCSSGQKNRHSRRCGTACPTDTMKLAGGIKRPRRSRSRVTNRCAAMPSNAIA
jgi:hypothetical protein